MSDAPTEVREVVRAAAQLERADGGRWHTQHEIALHAGMLTQDEFEMSLRPLHQIPEDDPFWTDPAMFVLWIAMARVEGLLDHRYGLNGEGLFHTVTEAGTVDAAALTPSTEEPAQP